MGGKAAVGVVGKKEMWHRALRAALSRARKFVSAGLKNGIARSRSRRVIKKHAKVKGRVAEEKRLRVLRENIINNFSVNIILHPR